MALPGNGIFVVQGEMNMLVTAMRRSTRWGSHSFPNEEYDVLMRTFQDLKNILYEVDDLRLLDPPTYLGPFLEVIRSKETNGPVTSLALSAIHKFLSYGLIDPTHPSVPATVEDIADAVTHARFVGTDHSSDGVVLMKILQVLRTLMLSPEGVMLTDESVCEIMLSCFRICFESRLTELLRRNAEQCLRDMTQLIFMRLPQFPPDDACGFHTPGLSLKKRDKPNKRKSLTNAHSATSLDGKSSTSEQASVQAEPDTDDSKPDIRKHGQDKNLLNEAEITIEPLEALKSPGKKHARHSSMDLAAGSNTSFTQLLEKCVADGEQSQEATGENTAQEEAAPVEDSAETDGTAASKADEGQQQHDESKVEEYVNHRGIRFTATDAETELQPYGLVCVKELFRFVISLCNPMESSNTSGMVHLGLSLAGTALEVCADHLPRAPALLRLLRDPLARNLLMLLNTERISIFALDLQVTFLLFESMRDYLKFQMEAYFKKLIEIISSDTSKAPYEIKEIHHLALESLIQFFKIPGFCAELYLNYDCDIYCMNVYEELTKLLSKNVVSSTSYDIHQLSLEALLTILEAIENGTQAKEKSEALAVIEDVKETKYGRSGHVTLELGGMDDISVSSDHVTHDISQYVSGSKRRRHRPHVPIPTEAELDNIKNIKLWVQQGTELFNQKPERGIEFLQEHGVLQTPLDPGQVAAFLRENPDLDKKMIGEYICKRSSREGDSTGGTVLGAFAASFEYTGLRIDQALRLYLETFRLPGEAPLIFLVMEKFAERWHLTNGEPFANTDAAFRLAYAVIMLNMDQHNHNAKKLNVPMTADEFVRNLRGCNGNGDFEQDMLLEIYNSIKNEEMVMPAERSGAVREAYLWRVLQRRGATPHARYTPAPPPPAQQYYHTLFNIACPPIVSALCAALERAPAEAGGGGGGGGGVEVALGGLERSAALLARLPPEHLTLDSLLLSLAKFTGLLTQQHTSYIAIGVSLGGSPKALVCLQRLWLVSGRHANALRTAWIHLTTILTNLFLGRLLPRCLVEVEDYVSGGTVCLERECSRGPDGLLSSIYSYIALGETGIRAPTPHEKALMDAATECVAKCNIPTLLITETKFLQTESLQELVKALMAAGGPPDAEAVQQNPQLEDVAIFYLELLGQVLVQNRDRVSCVWGGCMSHVSRLVSWSVCRAARVRVRVLTCVLRVAARVLRAHGAATHALALLDVLRTLPYKLFKQHAYLITCGVYELVKTSAQNLHSRGEWERVLALLCAAGAGAWPAEQATMHPISTSSRSDGSEDESERRPRSASSDSDLSHSPQTQGWIMVKKECPPVGGGVMGAEGWGSVVLRGQSAGALVRGAETLGLVVRDVAHLTPHSAPPIVTALTIFARAAIHAGNKSSKSSEGRKSRVRSRRGEDSSEEEEDTHDQYHMVSLQLLDLMHTLHSRTAQIFKWWRDEAEQDGTEDYDLWEVAWKPLLQGIAQFCTDKRKQIANSGIAYLQRALLAPGLSGVGGAAWEQCFHEVLCPLVEALGASAAAARPNTLACKVFLQHLSALAGRPGFGGVWARLVRVQRALLLAGAHHATHDAAREALKNMILVMDSLGIFGNGEEHNELWYMTWNTIDEFLPNLKEELFPNAKESVKSPSSVAPHMQLPLPASLPTIIPVGPHPVPSNHQVSPHNSPTQTSILYAPTSIPYSHTSVSSGPTFVPSVPASVQYAPSLVPSAPYNPQAASFVPVSPPTVQPQYVGSPVNIYQSAQSPVGMNQTAQSPVTMSQSAQSPVAMSQSAQSPVAMNQSAQSPVVLGQSPPSSSGLVMPIAVSGMVPIRNPLYDQAGLTSSVLLQPLNEMKSTPIGVSISQTPIVVPQPESSRSTEPAVTTDHNYDEHIIAPDIEQGELYADYLTNPYTDAKLSPKEATIYEPNVQKTEENNPLLSVVDKQKSFSANATPMHKSKAMFGSSDNLRQDSGIFNFSSYFSGDKAPGAEAFDSLVTNEG